MGVDSEGRACKCDNDDLEDDDDYNHNDKHLIFGDSLQDVKLLMQLSGIDEVEHLHHHKSVKNEGEVTGIDLDC